MTNPKKPKQNPIEEAIGDRAKDPKAQEKFTKEYQTEPTPETSSPPTLRDVPDQPLTQSETVTLEELNRRTEERLQDQYPEEEMTTVPIKTGAGKIVEVPQAAFHPVPKVLIIPVSKPAPQPVTKTCSPESPPQGIDNITAWVCPDCGLLVRDKKLQGLPCFQHGVKQEEREYPDAHEKHVEQYNKTAEKLGIPKIAEKTSTEIDKIVLEELPEIAKKEFSKIDTPAEDIELTALRKYILEDGFVVATVAFHIVSLCAQPMTTPSTTMWDFRDRASIPDMVLALLNQPGYLEGIWPSLRIVMSSNKGNAAWCAGIATTLAFFDVIRTLPALEELQNETEKKS